MFFVPPHATAANAIIATRISEKRNFLIVMVSRFTALKIVKSIKIRTTNYYFQPSRPERPLHKPDKHFCYTR
jgi:hypothetical protein